MIVIALSRANRFIGLEAWRLGGELSELSGTLDVLRLVRDT